MTAALWRRPGWAWCAVAALLGLGSAIAYSVPAAALEWQPGLAASEPWRAFSGALVHYSTMHMAGNAAGIVLVAALGVAARAPWRLALAWIAAWPLTQLGLLVQPEIAHYGGLSGLVHAAVAIICVYLIGAGHRVLGGAMLAGEIVKVLSEAPWGAPLRHPEGWDIAVAPLAHASGLIAGVLCALVAESLARMLHRREHGRAS